MKRRILLLVVLLLVVVGVTDVEFSDLLPMLAATPFVLGNVLGPRQLIDLAIPTGIDGARVFQFNLASGATAQEVITKATQVIGTLNERLRQRFGGFIYVTDQLYAYYRQGGSGRRLTPEKAEQTNPDGVKSGNIGHMLPIKPYRDAVGWSEEYLLDAPMIQLDGDIQTVADSWENRVAVDFWTRVLSPTENQVAASGWDVPWAIGTGTNVNFIPVQHANNPAFDSTHTHFKAVAGTDAAAWISLLNSMVDDLHHHGHTGRLIAYFNKANIETLTGMNTAAGRFVELQPQDVSVTGGNSNAPVLTVRGETQGVPGEIFGYYRTKMGVMVELRWDDFVPAGYTWMTKSYGDNNPRNGVALRIHPRIAQGFGLRVDPQLTKSLQPRLEMVLFDAQHGFGVNDRTNGVAGRVGNASYGTGPTI